MRYWVGRFGRRFDIEQMRDFQQHRNRISKYLFSWSIGFSNRIHRQLKKLKEKSFFKYLDNKAQKHFFLSLLIVKITPPISVPGQISFGFLKIPFWKFLIQTTFVCFLFESIFLNLGYFSSISANVFKDKFDFVTTIISSICIAFVALLL
jgi:membrane protein DedA with SNARE-associated domain